MGVALLEVQSSVAAQEPYSADVGICTGKRAKEGGKVLGIDTQEYCHTWPLFYVYVFASLALYIEEKINYRTACTSDTFCAKLVRATSVRVLPKCRPMIVYKREKLPHFFELHS